MRFVVQRVSKASVRMQETGEMVGEIGRGLCILIGVHRDDTIKDAEELVKRISKLRLWRAADTDDSDACKGQWERSVSDLAQSEPQDPSIGILAVSQFTLYGRTNKGSRPDFNLAMKSDSARVLFDETVKLLQNAMPVIRVATGAFGKYTAVSIENDGPLTLVLDSKASAGAQS